MIDRYVKIRNWNRSPVVIENVQSAFLHLPLNSGDYRLSHLHGKWGGEGMLSQQKVDYGKIQLESRTGMSGPYAMPFFALDDGFATEFAGEVWFGTLQWSGNWKISVERNGFNQLVVSGGIHDFDFSWNLSPGEEFVTPVFSLGCTQTGFSDMTQQMQQHIRRHIEPVHTRDKVMPLISNTYASFKSGEEMNEKNAVEAIRAAAEIGVELFVYDAGWQQALGDWTPHKEKFGESIKPQVDLAHKLGMKFGVWAEIESLDLHSKLFEHHPEWVMAYPDQFPDLEEVDGNRSFKRMLLNLGRDDVREYLYNAMDKLIGENDLDYFKIDMNRCFTHPGWANPPSEGARSIYVKYVQSLYSIFQRLQQKYPHVIFENCACGNFRADWGFNRFFSRVNRSDNQESLDVLKLHEGFNYLHLSKAAGGGCHISDNYFYSFNHREIPRRFQAFTGMMGSLSIGVKLVDASESELEELKQYGSLYKKLRHIVQLGRYYRIFSHFKHPFAFYEYVSKNHNEAVLFAFGHALQFYQKMPAAKLRDLDADAVYKITSYGDDKGKAYLPSILPEKTGRNLMNMGIELSLFGDLDCRIIHFEKQN